MLAVEEGVVSKSLICTSISTLHVPKAFADMQEFARLLNANANAIAISTDMQHVVLHCCWPFNPRPGSSNIVERLHLFVFASC